MNTNIIKIIIPLGLICLLFACNDVKPKKDLILETEMLGLLVNMHQLEARLEKYPVAKDTLAVIMHHNYQLLFERFNTTKEKFDKTLDYYQDNPAKMEILYEQVVDSLSVLQAEIKEMPEEEFNIDTLINTIDSISTK